VIFLSFELKFENVTKERFKPVANKLLNQCYLLKKKDDTRMDYLYVIQNKAVFANFFDILGYTLKIDEAQGVIGLCTNEKSSCIKLKKYHSICLLILRLLYAEARNELSLSDDVIVRVEQIHEKYGLLQIRQKPMIDKATLNETLTLLKKYNIIERLDNDVSNPDTRIKIYPSILFAVPNENISAVYKNTSDKLNKYAGGDLSDEANDEDQTD
jgi:hypothetical protein